MDHPTNLGPRQRQTARKEASMVAARAQGVLDYLRDGDSNIIRDDADAVAQLSALVEDANGLLALFGRAAQK